ncbi:MAG: ankyrin repeat domain-containing protein [Chloroflexi bacterium]|nr:ankyrin repeat domain-containing protein [Chloroflexota bacterium]MDA1004504.1 ankyrin repeat domain-containing protein [Chloroflexota bacterium]
MAEATPTDRMIAAAAAGDLAGVRTLVEGDAALVLAATPAGERAIHAAYYHGHAAVVAYLLEHGETEDILLDTQLGRTDRVRAHLDADAASVHTRYPNGAQPLHAAVFWGHPPLVELLLERGADPRTPTSVGFTPLHSAVAAPTPYCPGDDEAVVLEAVELLLAAGADPNARTTGGLTPLFTAAANGDLRVVQRLIAAGADPQIAGHDDGGLYANKRALDVAMDRGHEHVAAYLRELAGASPTRR